MNVIQLPLQAPPAETTTQDETLNRLVGMISATNKIALDKMLEAVYSRAQGYARATRYGISIRGRMVRAAREVRGTLPVKYR